MDTNALNRLPDPLTTNDGRRVTSAEQWRTVRRPELLKLAQEQMYGCEPERPKRMRFEVQEQASNALGGKATRKQVTIDFNGDAQGPKTELLIYIPNDTKGPVPGLGH